MVRVGQKVLRHPAVLLQENGEGNLSRLPIPGCVAYIHPEGRYHMVEFTFSGGTIRECFLGVDE